MNPTPKDPQPAAHETWVAVADLHGHLAQLDALLAHLDATLRADYRLCTLGDYVDNGPAIPALLDRLIALRAARGARFVPIVGNHDLALLRALGWPGNTPEPQWWSRWSTRYWDPGLGTPAAYGAKTLDQFVRKFPAAHADFLRALPWSHDTGRYLFVHAGAAQGELAPQRALLAARRLPRDVLHLPPMLRDKSLSRVADATWDREVVSAHNKDLGGPRFEGPNRICLSAEVDATGVLRAVILPARTWVSVGRDLRVVVEATGAG